MWDPSEGEGGNAEASEVLGGMLDEPGEAAVHLERRGRAVPHQLERVPLAVGQHCVPDGAFHLPSHTGVRDVEDVAVSQLKRRVGMSATAAIQCRNGKFKSVSGCKKRAKRAAFRAPRLFWITGFQKLMHWGPGWQNKDSKNGFDMTGHEYK